MAEISPLRRHMIEDMTVRNLSPATQQSYLSAVSKFSRYFGRSPDSLGLEDVHAFQVHLVATGISWPALNQIVCALRFFYGVTLGQATVPERIAYAREPSKLPVVLSADEVVRFLEAIPSLKSRTALTTVYAAGLRVSEVVLLKIAQGTHWRAVCRHGENYVVVTALTASVCAIRTTSSSGYPALLPASPEVSGPRERGPYCAMSSGSTRRPKV
jgi:integrase/recombinase XerD